MRNDLRAGDGRPRTPDGSVLPWARSAANASRARGQLLRSLGRALSALPQLRELTLICHTVSAAVLSWADTRSLHLPGLRLQKLTELSIFPSHRSLTAGIETDSGTETPAFALVGLGPQCELPSLWRFGAPAVFRHSDTTPAHLQLYLTPCACRCRFLYDLRTLHCAAVDSQTLRAASDQNGVLFGAGVGVCIPVRGASTIAISRTQQHSPFHVSTSPLSLCANG